MVFDKKDVLLILTVAILIGSIGFTPVLIIDKLNTNEKHINDILQTIRTHKILEHNILQNTILSTFLAENESFDVHGNGTHLLLLDKENNHTVAVLKDVKMSNHYAEADEILPFNQTTN